jgi:SAM-dependent methyltransferase
MSAFYQYGDICNLLRSAYDGSATARNEEIKPQWKLDERSAFLGRLHDEGRRLLIEVGAGAGQDSAFFKDNRIDVVATDLSPKMVELCKAKGVDAHVMDFLGLTFAIASFDAAYSMNSLLHVPSADIAAALNAIHAVLKPGALFFLGTYGGISFEGVRSNDWHVPPRFFSFRTDEQLLHHVQPLFDVVDFHRREQEDGMHFQSMTLRA